jgi:hypothetical protein
MKQRSEEKMPARIAATMTWSTKALARRRLLNSEFCKPCGKKLLRDKDDARSYIGLLLKIAPARPNEHLLRPYPCPMGQGWHIGHDEHVGALLRKGKALHG